ncbi:hypothetical protein GCM10027398_39170 [Azotobacter salinestris]
MVVDCDEHDFSYSLYDCPVMCIASTRRQPVKRRRKARNAPAEAPTTTPLPPLPHGKEACDKVQFSLF